MPARTTYSPAVGARIVEHVARGMSMKGAAALERVPYYTLREWLKNTSEPFASFAADLQAARATREGALLDRLEDYAGSSKERHPQSIAWLLERSFPNEYGAKVRLRVEAEHEVLFDAIRRELGEEIYARVIAVAALCDAGGEEEAGGPAALPPGGDPPG